MFLPEMLHRAGWIVVCSVLLLPGIAGAVVHEHMVYSYFRVKAQPARPLALLLNEASPHHHNDQVYHGYTDWKLNWHYRLTHGKAGRCSIRTFSTRLDVDIDLPSLEGGAGMQSEQFENYLTALRAHELGHYAIAREAATSLDSGVRAMQGKHSCTALKTSIEKLAEQINDRYRALEMQYDSETDHGRLQGVQLDW